MKKPNFFPPRESSHTGAPATPTTSSISSAPTTPRTPLTPMTPTTPLSRTGSESFSSDDEKEPGPINLLETKEIWSIMRAVNQVAEPEARKILKIFTKFIYDQGYKKNEAAERILFELRGLSRELMLTSGGPCNPLIEKYRYPLSIVYEKLCENFGFNRIKINSAYDRHVAPINSIFLPKLFRNEYGLGELYPLLNKPPAQGTRIACRL